VKAVVQNMYVLFSHVVVQKYRAVYHTESLHSVGHSVIAVVLRVVMKQK